MTVSLWIALVFAVAAAITAASGSEAWFPIGCLALIFASWGKWPNDG